MSKVPQVVHKPNFKSAITPHDGKQSHNSSRKYVPCLSFVTSVKPLHTAYCSHYHPQYVQRELDIQTDLYLSKFESLVSISRTACIIIPHKFMAHNCWWAWNMNIIYQYECHVCVEWVILKVPLTKWKYDCKTIDNFLTKQVTYA